MIRDLFPNVKKESQNKSPFRAEKYFEAARWTSRYADPLHYRVCGGGIILPMIIIIIIILPSVVTISRVKN